MPWAAFLVATMVAEVWKDGASTCSLLRLLIVSPVYVIFVAVPSALPLAAASRGWMRWAVLTVMSAVAIAAGVTVVTSDDAQAGLAVFLVPYVGVPLAGAALVVRATLSRLQRLRRSTCP